MNRVPLLVIASVLVLAVGAVVAQAQQMGEMGKSATTQPAAKAQVLCPVTNKPIDRNIVTRYHNRWVYFADADALQKFEKDPTQYAEGTKAQWEADKPLRVQVKCPVTGEKPNPDVYVGKGDDAVFFATDEAKQKWLKDSQPYQKRLDEDCYTYQTICIVGAGVIDPGVARDVDGKTVYFCCPACIDPFLKDKAKLLKEVDDQTKANRTAFVKRLFEKKLGEAGKQEAPKPEPPKKAQG
jgi:YHS domain-containing protein